jgi:hypothetical protein
VISLVQLRRLLATLHESFPCLEQQAAVVWNVNWFE